MFEWLRFGIAFVAFPVTVVSDWFHGRRADAFIAAERAKFFADHEGK